MKIIIAGGSGQVGHILTRAFAATGDQVVVLSRHRGDDTTPWIKWDGSNFGQWVDELNGADVLINLAGRSVNCRYNDRNRREILESRLNSVVTLGRALQQVSIPPRVWLQAATATVYAHRFDSPNDEQGVIGGNEVGAPDTWRFSVDVAKAWEAAIAGVGPLPGTRTVIMRSAMIMSPDRGGIFSTLLRLMRLGLGGRAGSGRQFVSWIHEFDFVRAVRRFIEDEDFSGAVNVCAPEPLPNAEFMRTLREASGMPVGLPASEWMLELGAFFMRTETELILKSRRVVPGRLLEHGFEFQFPTWRAAAADLCTRFRRG